MRLTGLPPLTPERPRLLLLGTFPGVLSLQKREYYGNPMNGFWKILCGALGVSEVPAAYAEKKRMLRRHGIALWDVFGSCERKGSGDHMIRNFCVSDVPGFLKKHPSIRKVILESRTAEKIWKSHFEKHTSVPGVYVPSPSSRARLPLPEKIKWWKRALENGK
ncbi:MAG TPA: DNA-deoxyinosine glycosylase [Verrucomicrobiae bacterium]|nr:DNA-deoxyinosine glycosylase [Verrucomicrobiae bacterium]